MACATEPEVVTPWTEQRFDRPDALYPALGRVVGRTTIELARQRNGIVQVELSFDNEECMVAEAADTADRRATLAEVRAVLVSQFDSFSRLCSADKVGLQTALEELEPVWARFEQAGAAR